MRKAERVKLFQTHQAAIFRLFELSSILSEKLRGEWGAMTAGIDGRRKPTDDQRGRYREIDAARGLVQELLLILVGSKPWPPELVQEKVAALIERIEQDATKVANRIESQEVSCGT